MIYQLHVRRLKLYTDKKFAGSGENLKHAITAQFKNVSVLHNHKGDRFDYRGARVRYIVINGLPQLVAFDDGLDIIQKIYRQNSELKVGVIKYKITGSELIDQLVDFGVDDQLHRYKSITPWLGLNQKNIHRYQTLRTVQEKKDFLARIFIGNYLSLAKTLGIFLEGKANAFINHFSTIKVRHANILMMAFSLDLVCNLLIPEGLGLGKLVSKGFGLMKKV